MEKRPAERHLQMEACFAANQSISVIQGQPEWERFHNDILIPSKKANSELLNFIRKNGYGFTFDIEGNQWSFLHPTLIITGRQDHGVGYQDQWRLIESYPRATFAVLDVAGHNLVIEQSVVFEALVQSWLDRLESEIQHNRLTVEQLCYPS